MPAYILKRVLLMLPTLAVISLLSFLVIQLPPGDVLTNQLAALEKQGELGSAGAIEEVTALRERYGLDDPFLSRYARWMGGILFRLDFGESFVYEMGVTELLGERMGLTFLVTLSTLFFTWAVAIPLGIYSAVRRYSIGDYSLTFLGFLGLATPNFLIALVLMYVQMRVFGSASVGGLFSAQYIGAPWSWGKIIDLAAHLWVPVLVIGSAGMATVLRIMRGNLLDVLNQPHVQAARAKGLPEWRVILKYAVRLSLNPLVSRAGMELPNLLSGAVVTSVVLGLPTGGPVFLNALLTQDMYLAGAFLLLASGFLLFGNLLADIVLAWLDPRIRYE